jgi:hypothetical protein
MRIILADRRGKLIDAWSRVSSDSDPVTTYQGSIFDVQSDALVSPANSFGFMDGMANC